MNRICYLIAVSFLFSAGSVYSQAVTSIKGKITGAFKDDVLMISDKRFRNSDSLETASRPVDEQFSFILNTDGSGLTFLRYKKQTIRLFIEPGNELFLSFGADSVFQNVVFSGKGAENNQVMKEFYSKFEKDFSDSVIRSKITASGIDDLENYLFQNRGRQKDYLKSIQNKSGVTDNLKKFLDAESKYFYFSTLLSFPFVKNPNTKSVTAIPNVMTEKLEQGSVSFDDLMNSPFYRDFLGYYVMYESLKANSFNYTAERSSFLVRENSYASTVLKGKVYLFWLTKTILDECENAKPETVKLLLNQLSEADKGGAMFKLANSKCGLIAQKKSPLVVQKPEKKSSDPSNARYPVKFTNTDGKEVLIDDFIGKVVYIDFWASWCGPCRGQFPFSKALHEKFTEKELKKIVFLYISIDDSESAWKSAIKQNELKGEMLRSPGGWNSAVCRFFHISSIPRYMIMDKSGEIIDQDAPRPSDETIFMQLKKLIE